MFAGEWSPLAAQCRTNDGLIKVKLCGPAGPSIWRMTATIEKHSKKLWPVRQASDIAAWQEFRGSGGRLLAMVVKQRAGFALAWREKTLKWLALFRAFALG